MSYSGGDTAETEEAPFAQALPALKQQGCSVLVVSAVSDNVHEQACQRLLGNNSTETRRRLIVSTGSDNGLGTQAVTDSDPTTRVIEHKISARTAAVEDSSKTNEEIPHGPQRANTPSGASTAWPSEDIVETQEIAGLKDRISTAIAEIRVVAGTLSSAELRVCFDSLSELVDAYNHKEIARLLHPVFTEVREVCGMAHCHLPVTRDAEIVDKFTPLFDAVVELRMELGCPRQRWHLQNGPSSEWLPLNSPSTDTRGGNR